MSKLKEEVPNVAAFLPQNLLLLQKASLPQNVLSKQLVAHHPQFLIFN